MSDADHAGGQYTRQNKTMRVFAEFLGVTLIEVMAEIRGKPLVE